MTIQVALLMTCSATVCTKRLQLNAAQVSYWSEEILAVWESLYSAEKNTYAGERGEYLKLLYTFTSVNNTSSANLNKNSKLI